MLNRLFARFRRDTRGLAALEFALILPVLIAMLFGMGELSLAVFCRLDVSNIASTVADLIAQEQAATSDDISNVYNAANTILYPYYDANSDSSNGKPSIRITSVIFDPTTKSTTVGKVDWSCAQIGNAGFTDGPATAVRDPGSTVTLAQPLLAENGSVLMAEVAYTYSSPTYKVIAAPFVMSNSFTTRPRRVGQITKPAACPAP